MGYQILFRVPKNAMLVVSSGGRPGVSHNNAALNPTGTTPMLIANVSLRPHTI
jgi:hypothetical protein